MNIKRIGNVILAVKDLDESIKFYHDTLGMPIKNERRNWVDLGTTGAALSLHPASITAPHAGSSIDNGILIGLTVGDVASAVEELKSKGVRIYRDIQERESGKNAIVLDPDDYMISLFEPNFSDEKNKQTSGYVGFTPQ
jgi:lactoylglutathione lyase